MRRRMVEYGCEESASILAADIGSALAKIPPRNADIIKQRYGLMGCQASTQEEVACRLGISQQRVAILEDQSFKILSALLRDYDENRIRPE